MAKKIDVKKVEKMNMHKLLMEFFAQQGIEADTWETYGMTEGTIVAHMTNCDVQIKLITPSAKTGARYPVVDDEVEVEE